MDTFKFKTKSITGNTPLADLRVIWLPNTSNEVLKSLLFFDSFVKYSYKNYEEFLFAKRIRVKKVSAAFELLRKKNRKAWKTTRYLLALPMIQLDKLVETADFILKTAPEAFKELVKSFIRCYVKGPKVRVAKSRNFRRKPPM